MGRPNTPEDVPMPVWRTDVVDDYLTFLNGSIENLESLSTEYPDEGTNSQVSVSAPASPPELEATTPAPNRRKRGRPTGRAGDDNEVTTKERRRTQIRLAQRAYRSRKEEKIAVLSNRVAELEQKLLIVRSLYLSTHAVTMSSTFPIDRSTTLKLLQDNLQLLLANTDVEDASPACSSNTESPPFIPDLQPFPILLGNVPRGGDMGPVILPDRSYMVFEDAYTSFAPAC